jgi:hypothetical protein
MIPYEELVAAIERWRIRNGLPVGDSVPRPAASAASGPSPAAPRAAASIGSAPVRAAPPGPAPNRTLFGVPPGPAPAPVQRPSTDLPVDLGDADVLEEELYGSDAGVEVDGYAEAGDDDASEKTSIGGAPGIFGEISPYDNNRRRAPDRGSVFDAYARSPEDDALDALDAGADVIDESSVDDDADLK